MKKLLLLGVLSLAALGVSAVQASACFGWLDGVFGCHCPACRSNHCRPYNAFDPVCCTSGHGGHGGLHHGRRGGPDYPPPWYNGWGGPYSEAGSCCINSGSCDFGSLPAPGTYASPAPSPSAPPASTTPTPATPTGPVFTPPPPNPLPATSQAYPAPVPAGPAPAYTAGYQPAYYPNAYPAYQPGYYPYPNLGYYPGQYPAMPTSPMPPYPWGYGR
jgi:hypothetical protein